MYSVLNASVLQINDTNEIIGLVFRTVNICPVSPNRYPWEKDLVVNMRQEMITRREHETLAKSIEFTQTRNTDAR